VSTTAHHAELTQLIIARPADGSDLLSKSTVKNDTKVVNAGKRPQIC